jgi:hypothetical protein
MRLPTRTCDMNQILIDSSAILGSRAFGTNILILCTPVVCRVSSVLASPGLMLFRATFEPLSVILKAVSQTSKITSTSKLRIYVGQPRMLQTQQRATLALPR